MSTVTNININIDSYSERAIVLRGDTEVHKEPLKALGGKWNARLRDGPGWIFPKTKQQEIENWIASGQLPTGTVVRSSSYKEEHTSPTNQSSSSSATELRLLREIKQLSTMVYRIEKLIMQLHPVQSHHVVILDSEEEEEEEEDKVPRKRLLI